MANDHEYLKNRYEIVSNVAKNYVGVKNVTLQIEILQFSLSFICILDQFTTVHHYLLALVKG